MPHNPQGPVSLELGAEDLAMASDDAQNPSASGSSGDGSEETDTACDTSTSQDGVRTLAHPVSGQQVKCHKSPGCLQALSHCHRALLPRERVGGAPAAVQGHSLSPQCWWGGAGCAQCLGIVTAAVPGASLWYL